MAAYSTNDLDCGHTSADDNYLLHVLRNDIIIAFALSPTYSICNIKVPFDQDQSQDTTTDWVYTQHRTIATGQPSHRVANSDTTQMQTLAAQSRYAGLLSKRDKFPTKFVNLSLLIECARVALRCVEHMSRASQVSTAHAAHSRRSFYLRSCKTGRRSRLLVISYTRCSRLRGLQCSTPLQDQALDIPWRSTGVLISQSKAKRAHHRHEHATPTLTVCWPMVLAGVHDIVRPISSSTNTVGHDRGRYYRQGISRDHQ